MFNSKINLVVGGRQAGKTSRLVSIIKAFRSSYPDEDFVIVVSSEQQKQHIKGCAETIDLWIDDKNILTIGEVENGRLRSRRARLIVDDAEMLIHRFFERVGLPVDYAAIGTEGVIEIL